MMAPMRTACISPFTWRDAPDLIDRLKAAQNHARFTYSDIMSFAGFMRSRAELEAYVVSKEADVAEYVPAKRRRAATKQVAA